MMIFTFAGFGCDPAGRSQGQLPEPNVDAQAKADSGVQARGEGDAAAAPLQKAVFAGGCFWCTEAVFQELAGVKEVISGYAGGTAETANYAAVSSGRTDHAEAIEITYDPNQITYGKLLQVFFATHDPTQLNAQGPDRGPQYRSAVFYASDEEHETARAYIAQLNEAGAFNKPIVTTLEPLIVFFPAEDYHQDYVDRNPASGYVRQQALPKVDKTREKFKDLLK